MQSRNRDTNVWTPREEREIGIDIYTLLWIKWASPMAQQVKNLPAIQKTHNTQEMWVRSLGREDSLEEEMATHSRILAWKNPMERGAWQAIVHGAAKNRKQLSD